MFKKSLWLLFIGLMPALILATDPPGDHSRAGSDGPHVFYKGEKIIVRNIELVDTIYKAQSELFLDRNAVTLTCTLPESGDRFSFPLKKELKVEKHIWEQPERMVVISDVEGNFEAMKRMLIMGGVIDAGFNWIFGNGHVVMVGDFFDRGLNVTECLWLAYKLESEADNAGGKVHFILGNHEIMNLSGYTEYVRRKYLENAHIMGIKYDKWFDANTELGRWLRTKNAVVRIGSYVFCHGGISPELAASHLSLGDINEIARKNIGVPIQDIHGEDARLVFNSRTGIFWYRGAVRRDLNQRQADAILRYAGADHMVVGHTIVDEITLLYDSRIVAIDQYHEKTINSGNLTTLAIDNGKMFVVDSHGQKKPVGVVYAKP